MFSYGWEHAQKKAHFWRCFSHTCEKWWGLALVVFLCLCCQALLPLLMYLCALCFDDVVRFLTGLPAWVASLSISIVFRDLDSESLERSAQLTERTTQMNACKAPLSAEELGAWCKVPAAPFAAMRSNSSSSTIAGSEGSGDSSRTNGGSGNVGNGGSTGGTAALSAKQGGGEGGGETRTAKQIARTGKTGGSGKALCVAVRDRFGDHGIVGLVVYTDETSTADVPALREHACAALHVQTFLVSCRSLHLGVEHAMLQRLAALATERGASEIRIRWRPSERNDAACHFFAGIPGTTFVAENATNVNLKPNGGGSATRAAEVVDGVGAACSLPASTDLVTATAAATAAATPVQKVDKALLKDQYGANNAENYKKFMTPDLELMSKKRQKKELKRRILEAKKNDDAWLAEKAQERAAKRATERAAAAQPAPNSNAASRHRPFGDKPAAGWVIVPVASAETLNVSFANSDPAKAPPQQAGNATATAVSLAVAAAAAAATAARLVRVTQGGSQRMVALHHETYLSVALALSAQQHSLAAFMKEHRATNTAAAVEHLLTPADGVVGREHNGRGAGADGTELASFQEDYTLREQARDHVKVMIQQSNPESYAHVEHTPKKVHRERVLAESRERRKGGPGGAPEDVCG